MDKQYCAGIVEEWRKAPEDIEVELPPLDIIADDWSNAADSVDSQDFPSSTNEAAKLACRERQLKAEIAAKRFAEATVESLKSLVLRAEKERDAALEDVNG